MDYLLRPFSHRRFLPCLIGAWAALSPVIASAEDASDEITAVDSGQDRTFVIAEREVYVARRQDAPRGELRRLLQERVAGAKVLEDSDTRALVQFPQAIDRTRFATSADDVSAALPEAEVQPVFYIKNMPRSEVTRRYGTETVIIAIPVGKTLDQVAKLHGAVRAEKTSKPGLALLRFATPFKALKALQHLRASGVSAEPMFARRMEKRAAAPLDQFFPKQWHLANVGQGGGTLGIDARALGAWDFTLGAGVTISIVDDCLQTSHPDLTQNCPPIQTNLHHDFIDKDNDPRPGPNDQHGTACAGLAAARQNNGNPNPQTGALLGVSGSAPEARLLGLRLIAGPFTDEDSASALYWHPGNTQVGASSNSWGPTDGIGLAGPDILTKDALKRATQEGRAGLGQVTLFAAGNGLQRDDDSNFDGYANSRFVIAVSAITNLGAQAFYSEPGANILIGAPSGGGTLEVTTTDLVGVNGYNPSGIPNAPPNLPNTDYTNDFSGTSAACPIVAGGVALMLAQNPNLGWRDVREILAGTARVVDDGDADWVTNSGGFHFNHKYGAGLVDLSSAVVRAQNWPNLGTELVQSVSLTQAPVVNPQVPAPLPGDDSTITRTFDFSANPNLRVEGVEVKINITHQHRSDLQVELVSPSGIPSILSPRRFRPVSGSSFDSDIDIVDYVLDAENGVLVKGTDGWTFSSTHYWGDNSKIAGDGVWTLKIRNFALADPPIDGVLNSATLNLYGTASGESRIVFDSPRYSVSELGGSQVIRARRLGPLTGEATVNFASTIGSATANSDYTPVSGTLHFSDGMEFADTDIAVPILDDALPELTETANVVLSNPVGASLGAVTLASVFILDDERNEITVVASDQSAAETDIGIPPDTGTFTIQRELATDQPVTVFFTLSGTAQMGTTPTSDYNPVPLSATILAFEKSVDVTIVPRNDFAIEGTETVLIDLTPDATYQTGIPSQAQIDIVDNDRPKVQIVATDNFAQENSNPIDTGGFRITRSDEDLTVPLTVVLRYEGTQINGKNYALLPTSVIIPVGVESVDLTITPIDDSIYQATKSVVVALQSTPDYDFQFDFLTSARINIVEDDPIPDTRIPLVSITTPQNKSRIPAPQATITASGTASDNEQVDKVTYQVNNGPWKLATIAAPAKSVNWSANITGDVVLGPNVLNVQSRDNVDNQSKVASVRFDYVEEHKLTVLINPAGGGTVTGGFTPDSPREAGKFYTITANASPGLVFNGWTGLATSFQRTLRFAMPAADATLTANFVLSPFTPAIAGNYSGLIARTPFDLQTSGFLKITVTSNGTYTGTLTFAGKVYPVKNEFSGTGESLLIVPRKKNTSLIVALNIDTGANSTQRITGSVDNGGIFSALLADRAAYSKTAPAPAALVKSYVLAFPPASPLATPQQDPRGNGVGTLSISADGIVTWKGTLGDGTRVSQTQPLTKPNGGGKTTWPLFLNLYKGTGVLLGTVTLDTTQSDSDLNAQLNWSKAVRSKDKYYPLGFSILDSDVIGSIYAPPAAGARALGGFTDTANNGRVSLVEGSLQASIVRMITLDLSNKITVSNGGTDQLALEINAAKGTFAGTFIHPVSFKTTKIKGVLFQKQQKGVGLFLGTSVQGAIPQTGRVTLEHVP